MRYNIFGDNLPAVTIHLENGESIYTQSGGMTWMTSGIKMETNMKGGLLKGLGRMLTGESMFMATFTANSPGQSITLASSFPGHIIPLNISGKSYIAQKSAFLCAEPTVELKTYVTRGLKAGLFGGEGFIMQELTGNGYVFLEADGSIKELDLAPGEKMKVQTGNVAAFESGVRYSVEMVKGFGNILFGGEGLFLSTVEGPGKVYLQTMTAPAFAQRIIPFLPKPPGKQ
ncbi:MAG: TIGR00266 family protein [Treponema sp.]|nr:TIGR00266 family protein [Treponema sp.]